MSASAERGTSSSAGRERGSCASEASAGHAVNAQDVVPLIDGAQPTTTRPDVIVERRGLLPRLFGRK